MTTEKQYMITAYYDKGDSVEKINMVVFAISKSMAFYLAKQQQPYADDYFITT